MKKVFLVVLAVLSLVGCSTVTNMEYTSQEYSIRVHDNYTFNGEVKDGVYQLDENEVITCIAENGDTLTAGVLQVVSHGASGFTWEGKTYTGETDVYDVVYTEGHGFWIGRE